MSALKSMLNLVNSGTEAMPWETDSSNPCPAVVSAVESTRSDRFCNSDRIVSSRDNTQCCGSA